MTFGPSRAMQRLRALIARRNLGSNLLMIAVFLVAARMAGALREVVIARQFGVGELVDAYVILFAFVTFAPMLWTNTLQAVVVPQLMSLSARARDAFISELIGVSLLLGLLISGLIFWLAPAAVTALSADLSDIGVQYARAFGLGLAPIAAVGVFISILTALLVAVERRSVSLLEALPPICVIGALLVMPSAAGLIVGSLIGIVAHAIAAIFLVVREGVWRWPRFSLSAQPWEAFWRAAVLMIVVFLLAGITYPIDQGIALTLEEGAASRFGYAYRILGFLLALATITIGRAMLPAFVRSPHLAMQLTIRWAPISFTVGLGIALFIGYFAEPVVALLFERGAFTPEDTQAVAGVLRLGLWQLPPYFAGIVLLQLVMSLRRYELMIVPSIIMVTIKVAGSLLLVSNYGLDGLMISSAISYTVMLVVYLYVVGRQLVPEPAR